MEYKAIALDSAEIKFLGDGTTDFTGYASVFGGVDSYGDTIHPGAFTKAVGAGREVKMYFNHGWKQFQLPIGKMTVVEDERGLLVKSAEFTRGLRMADEVALALQHRTVSGLSIGYRVASDGFKSKGAGQGRDIYRIDFLKEVSVVDWPADEAAQISMKAAIDDADSLKEMESLLRDAGGFSRADACALVSRIKSLAHGERDAETKRAAEVLALFQQSSG